MTGTDPTSTLLEAARQGWERHREAVAAASALLPAVDELAQVLITCFGAGRSAWTFGNGGSAAAAQHLSGELLGHYERDRRALPCLALGADWVVASCTANDYDFTDVFARQLEAVARPGDVVCAFTTSGRSPNVVRGLDQARSNGATTVLFAGTTGGDALRAADHALLVPDHHAPRIQEVHVLLLHLISDLVDRWAVQSP